MFLEYLPQVVWGVLLVGTALAGALSLVLYLVGRRARPDGLLLVIVVLGVLALVMLTALSPAGVESLSEKLGFLSELAGS